MSAIQTKKKQLIGICTLEGEKLGVYLIPEEITEDALLEAYFDFEQYLLDAEEQEEEQILDFARFCRQILGLPIKPARLQGEQSIHYVSI